MLLLDICLLNKVTVVSCNHSFRQSVYTVLRAKTEDYLQIADLGFEPRNKNRPLILMNWLAWIHPLQVSTTKWNNKQNAVNII